MNWLKALGQRTPLGWLQLNKEKGRFLVALSGVAFADILMLMQLGFQGALFESGVQLPKALEGDIIISSSKILNFKNADPFSRRRMYQALDVPGVDRAEPLYLRLSFWKHPETLEKGTVLIMGFDPSRAVMNRADINAQLDKIRLPDRLLFDQATRGDFASVTQAIQQGQSPTTEINDHQVKLDGLISFGSSFASDGTLVGSDQTYLRLFPDQPASSINFGVLYVEPGADVDQVARAVRDYLPDDVKVFTKEELIAFEQSYWSNNTAIGFIFSLGVAMGFLVGVIIVYQVLATDVNSHMEEYATFRAMGYGQKFLLGIVLEEAVILAVLGFVPSLGIATGLYHLTRGATALPIAMSASRATGVLIATLAMCLLSGAIATRRLKQADPADIF